MEKENKKIIFVVSAWFIIMISTLIALESTTTKKECDFNSPNEITVLIRAIKYRPFDFRAYAVLLKALFKGSATDQMPDWKMSEPLGEVRCGVIE